MLKEGDWLSFDGLTGEVKIGQVATQAERDSAGRRRRDQGVASPTSSGASTSCSSWADDYRRLGIRANADQPDQAEIAYGFGARGIGLCRTEHMFFGERRIPIVQEMILADNEKDRRAALAEAAADAARRLLRRVQGDARVAGDDPDDRSAAARVPAEARRPDGRDRAARDRGARSGASSATSAQLLQRVEQLHEFNPMLGHRGVRLGITYPEITEMQTRAIIEAACQLTKEGGTVVPEIMIPLVGDVRELRDQKAIVSRVADEVMKEQGVSVKYLVGTMIEVPRGAITADEIAQEAEFFSFGTNDLTQLTYGFSRDDIGKFLGAYQDARNPRARSVRVARHRRRRQPRRDGHDEGPRHAPNLKVGVCGEHGGDPSSIHFFDKVGLDYVSCSPYRVPVARLAAAQAALKAERVQLAKGRGELEPASRATEPALPILSMLSILVHRDGARRPSRVDPAWLAPGATEIVWVDLE